MGRKRKSAGEKPKKRKAVLVKLIEREHAGRITAAYRLIDILVAKTHHHLSEAKIACAWRFGWKSDSDGRLKLASVKKGSDLDRELNGYDFVIMLNHEVWNAGTFKEDQMIALLDHQLCHCQLSMDSNGEVKTDDMGRNVYRLRKHDIEEFRDVVARHGLYTDELQEFYESMRDKLPLFPNEDEPAKPAKAAAKKKDKPVPSTGSGQAEEQTTAAGQMAEVKDPVEAKKPGIWKGDTDDIAHGTNGASSNGTNGHNGKNRIRKHLAGE